MDTRPWLRGWYPRRHLHRQLCGRGLQRPQQRGVDARLPVEDRGQDRLRVRHTFYVNFARLEALVYS